MNEQIVQLILKGISETFFMVLVSSIISYIIGIPLGVIVYITDRNGICRNKLINFIVGLLINIVRSVPFLILLVAILPFTRIITGTGIGVTATIVPLVVATTPFIARLVESSLKEIDPGVVEAARAFGSSKWQIVYKVYLPESKPSLITGVAITLANVIGYSAMAGFVGGGGLGAIAVNYGYYRYQSDIMLVTIAILIVIVQVIQTLGLYIAAKLDQR